VAQLPAARLAFRPLVALTALAALAAGLILVGLTGLRQRDIG
jgi:putative exporter of polyketide antibiotics